ncbi:hypothetical protein F4811DRAFT_503489 [Daldinia bambusicola]|nr:hypothetical protein F4811DRAFT_503489 [Daldinia bambusicola]
MYYQGGTLFTSPYPSSTPQQWDPKVAIGLYNVEKQAITCPGFAKSKGRRCWKVPARHKVKHAEDILRGPASKPFSEAVGSPELGQAANILLCIYHIDQYSDIVRQWRASLTSLASKHDSQPPQNGMNPQQQKYLPKPKERETQEEERRRREEARRREEDWRRNEEEQRRREDERRRRQEKRAREREYIERVLLDLERAQQLESWRSIQNLYRSRVPYSQGLLTPPLQVQQAIYSY